MEFQISIIVIAAVLVNICSIIYLVEKFEIWIRRLVEKLVKELEKIED